MRSGAMKRRTGKAVAWLLAGLLLGGGVGAGAMWLVKRQKATVGGDANLAKVEDLSMVPADALGFVHVRLAEMWKSDAMEQYRKIVEKAGPQALAALDEGFVPAPSSVDRITVVFLPPSGGGGPQALAIVAFSARFDADAFVAAHLPSSQKRTVGGQTVWVAPDVAATFPKDKLLVIGPPAAVEAYCAKPPTADGPLAPALKEAAGGTRHALGAINMKAVPFPPQAFDQMPAELRPLMKAESISLGVAVTTDAKIELRAVYADAQAATDAEAAVKSAADLGRKQLAEPIREMEEMLKGPPNARKPRPMEELPKAITGLIGLGAIKSLDEFLAAPPTKRNGNEVAVTVHMPSVAGAYVGFTGVAAGLLLPAVQKVREAAGRAQGGNNLKQMALAMHSYNDVRGTLPPTHWGSKIENGLSTGNLSWRVAILPYIEQDALYRQFKLDEPWDSEHNKKLIPLMPKIFECPRAPTAPGTTYYKVITPAAKSKHRTPFGEKRSLGILALSNMDGSSNTIMIVEGGSPVTWTKPDDIVYDSTGPLPNLAVPGIDAIMVVMSDGSTRTIDLRTASEKLIRALITADGGETVDR